MVIKKETVLFCAPDDEISINEARKYIQDYKITQDQAAMKKQAGFIVIIAKTDFKLEER